MNRMKPACVVLRRSFRSISRSLTTLVPPSFTHTHTTERSGGCVWMGMKEACEWRVWLIMVDLEVIHKDNRHSTLNHTPPLPCSHLIHSLRRSFH